MCAETAAEHSANEQTGFIETQFFLVPGPTNSTLNGAYGVARGWQKKSIVLTKKSIERREKKTIQRQNIRNSTLFFSLNTYALCFSINQAKQMTTTTYSHGPEFATWPICI